MRILYVKDAGNSDVSNIRKKKSVVYSNAEGLGENAAKDKGNVDKDKRCTGECLA